MKRLRREKVSLLTGFICIFASMISSAETITFENDYVRYVISEDGRNLHFMDRRTGEDFCHQDSVPTCASVQKNGQTYGAKAISFDGKTLTIDFGPADVSAAIQVTQCERYFLFSS